MSVMKIRVGLICLLLHLAVAVDAQSTYIRHLIVNSTPFTFYYNVIPTTEVPTAFSCQCSGLIAPGETQNCDCYSDLEAMVRPYRIEYMKNVSPSYRLSVTINIESNALVIWKFFYDNYWEWVSVKTSQTPLDHVT